MTKEKKGMFIFYRICSTLFCDQIFFMETGAITEEGSHENLMAEKGAYAELFNLQAKYYQQKRKEEESYA